MAFLSPSPMELVVILVIALLVLGPKRLPETARSLGRGLRELRDTLQGLGHDDDDEDDDDTVVDAERSTIDSGPPYDDDLPDVDPNASPEANAQTEATAKATQAEAAEAEPARNS